jgi:alkylation response protein AidB-like acyl-CoA dehydrogenase
MTAAQKGLYLGNVGRKQMLLNGFYTEGGGARSILSPNTKARKVPGGYRINGQKVFCTLSPIVDYFGISTSLEDYKGSASGGCVFLLPRNAPGLEVIENWDAMGMRATGSHTIMIRDVFAAQDQLIGEEGHFFEEFVKVAHWYCLSFSAIYVGIGQAAYNYVLEYARTRKLQKTGQLVGSLPATRFALGEMYNRLEACRTLIYSLAGEMSEGRTYGERQVMTIETLRTFVAENMLGSREPGNANRRRPGLSQGQSAGALLPRPALGAAAHAQARRSAGDDRCDGTGLRLNPSSITL